MRHLFPLLLLLGFISSFSIKNEQDDPRKNKGIGPVKKVILGKIDTEKVELGRKQFNISCTACHKLEGEVIGPALGDVLSRRSPEWVMNMVLNTDEMVEKDPLAKKVYEEYAGSPMVNMGLNEEQVRNIIEYLRTTTK